jgi:hypothetical protein
MQMTTSELQEMWMVDYGPARDRAIGWLGQRYILATPVNRVLATDVPASGRSSRNGTARQAHKEYGNEV